MKYEKGKKITDVTQFKKGRKYMVDSMGMFGFSHIGKDGNPYFKDEGQGYGACEDEYNCIGLHIYASFYEAVKVSTTLDDKITELIELGRSKGLKIKKQIMKNLVGRKVKGFKFESGNICYNSNMDEYIGQVGEIHIQMNESVRVMFEDKVAWSYPLNQITEHLVPEYEIGKEYEFSDNGKVWFKRRLVGIIDHKFKYVSYNGIYVLGYKQIREIKPKVKEVTLEEAEEKLTEVLKVQIKIKK